MNWQITVYELPDRVPVQGSTGWDHEPTAKEIQLYKDCHQLNDSDLYEVVVGLDTWEEGGRFG